MKMKKMLSLLTATAMAASCMAGFASSASAATEADIVPISSTATYWFDDYMSAGLSAGDLIGESHFFSAKGNSYAANKGNYDGNLACLRLKNVQNVLQFSVSKPAEVTVYTQAHGSRGTVVTSTVPSSAYASYDAAIADTANVIAAQEASTSSFTFSLDAAADLCLSSYAGDFYIAGVGVTILTTDPEISVSPASSTINLGDTLTINATTQNTGDAAVVWSSDNEAVATVADGVVTTVAPGTANITATVTVNGVDYSATCALTVQDVATITFDISNVGGVTGTAPEAITVTKGETITIPVNNSLYMGDGISLKGWDIGSGNVVATGSEVTLTNDITARPTFAFNEANLGDAETSVTFYFGEVNGAPTTAVQGANNPSAIIVAQTTVGEEVIDVKADIDASAGKFNNYKRGDKWAQVNGGTIISVPVLAGSVVTMGDIYNDAGTYTIGGVEYTGDGGTYTATAAGTVDIVAGTESGGYWESVTVTYPQVEAASTPEPTATPTPTPAPTAAPVDLVADFTGEGILTADEVAAQTKVDFGINAAGERVAADSTDAVMVVDATTHASVHGLIWFKSTITVSGPAMITAGTCAWGADLIVKDADGNEVAKVNTNNGTCFHGDKTNNVVVAYYKGEGTTLSISGGNYLPYIAVKEIDASEIPNDATVTYDLGSVAATGTVPTAQTVEVGSEATIPVNRTLYVEGSTLTGWTDGTNTYAPGAALTVTENITLTPVFTANTAALGDADATVAFDFQQKNGTPVVAYQGGTNFLVYQATIGEAVIDVKMDVDTTSGKLANGSWQDWAQVNVGTKFIVPALAGSTVTVDTIYNDGNYTINGTAYTQSGQSTGETVTITDAATIEIVAGDPTGSYWRGFTVTYPKAVEKTYPTVTVAEFGTYTENAGNPAKAYTGTFTVDPETNNPVNCVKWTVGEATAVSSFGTTISSGTVVTGLVVVAADLDAIPAPTAEAGFAN